MRIGQITFSYKPIRGGAEAYLDQLNKVFLQAGHTVRVYQPDTGINDPEIVPVKLKYSKLPNLINFNFSLLSYLKKLWDEDVLVIHYPEHFWPLFWHRRAVVLTHGINWDFDNPSRKFSRWLMAKFAYHFSWKFVANDTNFLRAVGVEISPREKMFQRVDAKQYFIPNCIDPSQFKKVDGPSDLVGKKLIIVPRNFTYPRGVDLAAEAMAIISKKDPEVQLLLVGDALPTRDSQEFKKSLLAKVEELGLQDKVIFYGNRSRSEMPGIYSSGLVTIIPTRGNEGTSLSALESMAVGTPVITTDVAGLRDLPSYQCQPTVESIAEAVLTVLAEKGKFSKEQQDVVRENYNLDKWAKAWLEVVEQ